MRIALKFSYDGRNFHGYARQPGLKTIEGELIKSLIKHGLIEDTVESFFRSASRTDRGVSALGNVVAFNTDTSKKRILEIFADEPTEIIIYGIEEVESDFNPRYAKYRWYRYYLAKKNFDFEKLISFASCFTGEHNFSNFARVEEFKDPVRIIENIVLEEMEDYYIIDFYAQTFLWNQIRRIISVLEKSLQGKITKVQIVEALCNPDKDVDFGLAPAKTLTLMDIVYDFEFVYDNHLLKRVSDLEKKLF
jgi:tRNA pseudouridine38-40 synthase